MAANHRKQGLSPLNDFNAPMVMRANNNGTYQIFYVDVKTTIDKEIFKSGQQMTIQIIKDMQCHEYKNPKNIINVPFPKKGNFFPLYITPFGKKFIEVLKMSAYDYDIPNNDTMDLARYMEKFPQFYYLGFGIKNKYDIRNIGEIIEGNDWNKLQIPREVYKLLGLRSDKNEVQASFLSRLMYSGKNINNWKRWIKNPSFFNYKRRNVFIKNMCFKNWIDSMKIKDKIVVIEDGWEGDPPQVTPPRADYVSD